MNSSLLERKVKGGLSGLHINRNSLIILTLRVSFEGTMLITIPTNAVTFICMSRLHSILNKSFPNLHNTYAYTRLI